MVLTNYAFYYVNWFGDFTSSPKVPELQTSMTMRTAWRSITRTRTFCLTASRMVRKYGADITHSVVCVEAIKCTHILHALFACLCFIAGSSLLMYASMDSIDAGANRKALAMNSMASSALSDKPWDCCFIPGHHTCHGGRWSTTPPAPTSDNHWH